MTRPDRYHLPTRFGLGGVALGNEFTVTTDAQAQATLETAWEAGVRYFDVAPWYGLGLAERRYGQFLHRQPRESYTLSSKVGKLLKASKDNRHEEYYPLSPSPNDVVFDYSADGVTRSIEDSLQRMGIDSLDVVFVHDLSPDMEAMMPSDWQSMYRDAAEGAFPALCDLRDQGVIKAWGMGVNTPEPILRCMADSDPDIHLLASQYSLIDHANAVEAVFPKARETGNSFVIGSALNAGFLAGASRYMYGDDGTIIPAEAAAKRDRLLDVARRHGTDLLAASIQFAMAPDLCEALVVGAGRPDEIIDDAVATRTKIAPGFWEELRAEGLIHADAAIPAG